MRSDILTETIKVSVSFPSNLERISNDYEFGQANKIGASTARHEDEQDAWIQSIWTMKKVRVMNKINKSDERYSRYDHFQST